MEDLSETVAERVHQLVRSKQEPILSTTGTRAAIDLLAARTEVLEASVRELTELVQDLARSRARENA